LAIAVYDQSALIDPEQQSLGHHRRVNFFNGTADWEAIAHDELIGKASAPEVEASTSQMVLVAFHEEQRRTLISCVAQHTNIQFEQSLRTDQLHSIIE